MTRMLAAVVIACIGCMSASGGRGVPGELGADGALRFASADEFFDAVDAVGRLTHDELDAWERAIGFRSMRRAFAELELEVAAAPGDASAALLAANADVLDPGSVEATRRVGAHGYASLIDRRGIYYVGGVVHKVTADQVVTARDGDPATAEAQLTTSRASGFRYTETANLQGACGNFFSGVITTSDRRERYALRTAGYIAEELGGRQYRYAVEMEMGGEKKNLFGSWVSYNTTYQLYEFMVDMDVMRVIAVNGNRTQYDYVRRTISIPNWDSPDEAAHITVTMWVGDTLINPVPAEPALPSFHKAHMETTSRGTFPTRGIIECGFCGDGVCSAATNEDRSRCITDCGFCGDNICWVNESAASCYSDCHCGDGVCDPSADQSCPSDCGGSQCRDEPCKLPSDP
jgi:hypothetical protein